MESYEEWDMTLPSIPPRSCLYHLDPVGVGTPYVESLTSYVARLALAHSVTPKALITKVILPLQGKVDASRNYYYRLNKFWHENASTLNGVSLIASEWVDTLQTLTGVSQLRFLTMLTWRSVIALNRLLRRSKAWCPHCYEEWRSHCQVLYEPLLWSLSGIDVCLCHQRSLMTQCPHCSKALPFLTQTMRPGYCPYCASFLGDHIRLLDRDENPDMKWQYWKVKETGALLVVAPHLSLPPPQEHIARRLETLVESYAAGNISALARFLGVTTQAIWGQLYQGNVPFFGTLLKMCYTLSLTPVEFLTTTREPSLNLEKPHFSLSSLPVVSRGKSKWVTEEDVQRMRQTLEAVLAADHPTDQFPCLKEIARQIGFDDETVRKHCPDLARTIARRYRRQWTEEGNHSRMKQALEIAKALPNPVPLWEVARQLHCDTAVLRKYFPDLCEAIVTRYRERYDVVYIEQRLREVLTSRENAPSLNTLTKELGCQDHVLKRLFPDLCQQISTRRHRERERGHQVRLAATGEKIRQAVLQLHEQGVYPSVRKVLEIIGDPSLLREKALREIWWLTLQELGYPTETTEKDA